MFENTTSRGSTAANLWQDGAPSTRGRDGRETTQYDSDVSSGKEDSGRGRHAPHGTARFLAWVGRLDRDPELDELSALHDEWQRRQDDGSEQADLTEVLE